jgi:hypothetical protein
LAWNPALPRPKVAHRIERDPQYAGCPLELRRRIRWKTLARALRPRENFQSYRPVGTARPEGVEPPTFGFEERDNEPGRRASSLSFGIRRRTCGAGESTRVHSGARFSPPCWTRFGHTLRSGFADPLAMCNVLVAARAQAADVSFIARWDFGASRYPGSVAACACADHGGIGTVSP